MRDFTDAEKEELSETVWNFIEDRKLDGTRCVVIVNGRGSDVVAFSSEDREIADTMLANAYRSVKNYKDRKAN